MDGFFAGLPIIIRELPAKYENKEYFVGIFKKMAAKLTSLQSANGFWHASLLDPASYPNPEMSATAFYVYGLAWGINNGYLEKEKYLPAVVKGWKSMVTSVWARWESRLYTTYRSRSQECYKGDDRSLWSWRISDGRNGDNEAYR